MDFIEFFRSTAPYIHAHRKKTLVVLITGEALSHANSINLVPDLALLNSLGLKVVLVYGTSHQIDMHSSLSMPSNKTTSCPITREKLKTILEEQGMIRSDLEAQFSMGLINSPMHNARVRCVSGNFVQAKPLGVINGVDLEFSGTVRNIDAEGITEQLNQHSIVLIPALGYSTTGETFGLSAHKVAIQTAAAIKADKLLIINTEHSCNRNENLKELSLSQSDTLLTELDKNNSAYLDVLAANEACFQGVNRCHLLAIDQNGGLLSELFTRDGSGLMVTLEPYDSIRSATIGDIPGIIQLLEPLESQGILVKRSPELLEQEISSFVVNERDGMIIGCAALYELSSHTGELGCVAVHDDYRHGQRGDRLLKAIKQNALKLNMRELFVLTTQTAHWFIERGFTASDVSELPEQKKSLYNYQRNSKVFRLLLN